MADPKHRSGEHPASAVMRSQGPRPQLELERLHYHLVQPRSNGHVPALVMGYTVWREGWAATFRELHGAADLFSDDFTRLDQIGVLVYEGRCVSVTGIRWLDLSLPWSVHDSYFRSWPRHVLDALGTGLLCISCNTIVAPEWRGGTIHERDRDPMTLKDVTIRMSLRRFVESQARVFVGVARNDRNMHRVAGDLGSRRMARIQMHGIDSDICGWTRSDVVDLGPIVEELWRRRTES